VKDAVVPLASRVGFKRWAPKAPMQTPSPPSTPAAEMMESLFICEFVGVSEHPGAERQDGRQQRGRMEASREAEWGSRNGKAEEKKGRAELR
jgi:hypothetical protein